MHKWWQSDKWLKHLVWFTPLFVLAFILTKLAVQGPFWLHQNGDYNYVYLLSGLDHLHFKDSGVFDQPGVPVKFWNAICIAIIYAVRYPFINASIREDVLINSELYLTIISISVVLITCYALYKFLSLTYTWVPHKMLWALAALSLFISSIGFNFMLVNKPEPYLIIGCLWMGKLILQRVYSDHDIGFFELGTCIAFTMLTKITALPFILIFFGIGIGKYNLKYASLTVLLYILACFTISPLNFLSFLDMSTRYLLGSGAYGQGSIGLYEAASFTANGIKFIKITGMLIAVLAAGFMYNRQLPKLYRSNLMWFGLAYFSFFLLILKHPASHYFIPAFILLPTFILVAFKQFKPNQLISYAAFIVLGVFLVRGMLSARNIHKSYHVWHQYEDPQHIQTYYSSSKAYALFIADKVQFDRNSAQLIAMYPQDTFYDHDHNFYQFGTS